MDGLAGLMAPPLDEHELQAELAALAAESMGWLPLDGQAYLHTGAPEDDDPIITVVGIPDAGMAGMNVLLLT